MTIALDSVDIHDPRLYVERGYPWAEWDLLRREAPVYWYERDGIAPFWAITRHADVLEISKNSSVFINGGPRLRLAPLREERAVRSGGSAPGFLRPAGWDPNEPHDMVFMDDPRHKKFRVLVSSAFTPARLRPLEPRLDAMATRFADEFVETLEGGDVCDFVRGFATKLPLATIGEMMGLPPDDWSKLLVWTGALLGDLHSDYVRDGEQPWQAVLRAVGEMRGYFQDLIDRRRAAGSDGPELVDVLLRGRVDGQPLTDQQLHGFLLLLTAAGNETTRNATTGGVIALLEHPDQRDLLCSRPDLVDSAVEEILRWTSPVVQFARTVTRDFELSGTKLREGDTVGIFYPSANRDEAVFDEPYRFDVTRSPNRHLAFGGYGTHFCLGANLARWELRAVFRALLPILPRMELAGPATRVPNLHVPGFSSLPVRLR